MYVFDKRILVVDDEKYNLDAMMFLLKGSFKKMGKEEEIVDHLVDYANDGQEAIDMYKKSGIKGQPYCLIIIDYSMPKMDGYEATKLIREACRE